MDTITPAAPLTRRGFFSPSVWRQSAAASSKPAASAQPAIHHEDGDFETHLVDGRLASHMSWPAFSLVDHRGRAVDLHRDIIAGHSVVLSFFYTQCKGSCPVTTSRMTDLAEVLGAQGRAVRFISITLEPDEDTPTVLGEYARDVLPAAADWHLLTGAKATITALRRHLGFYDLNPAIDADPRRHAAMVLMGNDRTHRWITLPAISSPRQWRSALSRCMA